MIRPPSRPIPSAQIELLRLVSGKVDVAAWIKQLGVAPIHEIKELAIGVWANEESVDDFLAARRGWRAEEQSATLRPGNRI